MKDAKGRWLPGASGNPKGRPRTGLSIAELCRGQVEKRNLIEKLGQIAARVGEYAKVEVDQQIRAIELMVRYGYGLPGKGEIDAGDGIQITVTYVQNQLNIAGAPSGAAEGAERGAEILRPQGRPPLRKIDIGSTCADSRGTEVPPGGVGGAVIQVPPAELA
jgi:hypothetical protein